MVRASLLFVFLPTVVLLGDLVAVRAAPPGDEEPPDPIPKIDEAILDFSRSAELSMQYHGGTAEQCRRWQRRFHAKLAELLGECDPPEKWGVIEEGRQEFEDHVRHELVLFSGGVPPVPVYLLVPTGLKPDEKRPAVLCIHGHGPHGHHPVVGRTDIEGVAENIERNNYDYGLQFVRRGYVVAAPCMIPFGRRVAGERYRGNDPCAVTFVCMQALGKLPMAENLRDLRWSIDLLQSRPEVDGKRIGCAGLSYGGRMTMLASAVDERIKVAAISGALNLLQERITVRHSCGSQVIPGLLEYGDYSEIGSLIAPRPCVWEVGSRDGLISPTWADLFRKRIERAYRSFDASGRLHFDEFDGGHRWKGRIAYQLFDEVLKNELAPGSINRSAQR